MRTKLLSLVLAFLMALSMASAFAYDGSSPISEEPVTLSILSSNSGSKRNDVDQMTWFNTILEKANVKLEMEIVDSSTYDDVVQPRLAAAQDLPDIVRLGSGAAKLTKSGIFIPLNDLIDKYGYNMKKMYEKFPNMESSITAADGNVYYVPYILATESNSRTVTINTQFLDALGMTKDDIKTLDDFYDYLVAVRDNDVNGNGDPSDEYPLFSRAGMINLYCMYWGLDVANTGGFPIDDEGNVFCAYITDEYKDYLTWVNNLYNEGLLNAEFLSANYDMQAAAFAENRIGAMMHFVSNVTGYSTSINPEWDFYKDEPIIQIIALERLDNGEPVVYGRGYLGAYFGITTACENPEAAFKFLDYMYSEEAGKLAWYGVEGVDYNYDENGNIVFTDVYYEAAGNVGYRGDSGWNNDALAGLQYDYASVQCPEIFRQINEYAQYIWNPSRMGKFYTDEQQEVINTYLTDLNTYFDENTTAFMLGTKSLDDDWDAFVQGAIDMGVEKIIEVYQEAEG